MCATGWNRSEKVILSVTLSLTYALFRARYFRTMHLICTCICNPFTFSSFFILTSVAVSNGEKLVCFHCTWIRFQQIIHVLHSTSAWNLSEGKIIENCCYSVRERERIKWRSTQTHQHSPEWINEQANNNLHITECAFKCAWNGNETNRWKYDATRVLNAINTIQRCAIQL